MPRQSLRSILVILVAFSLMPGVSSARAHAFHGPRFASSPSELINAVNALRASYGLAPYTISPVLMAVAQSHADYMAATGTVSHTGSGGSSVTERLLAAGYPLAGDLSLGGFRSENITSGNETKSAQDAVNGWTGDAPHLTTMISPSLTEIGAGVSVNAGRVYYVIDCALPTTDRLPQPAAVTTVAAGPTVVPGAGVVFPVIVSTPNADGDVFHEVKAGQSLWQIAISYQTKIEEIKRLNNLYTNDIFPGERLLVRKGQITPTSTPAETATAAITASATGVGTVTAVTEIPSATAALRESRMTVSTSQIMSAAIGIITLTLLGVIFMFLGEPKKTDRKSKQ
jgi:uncharacterized protein YkwD/LysM repeat protein